MHNYPPTLVPWHVSSGAVFASLRADGTPVQDAEERPICIMVRNDFAARAGIMPVERDANAHLIAATTKMLALLCDIAEHKFVVPAREARDFLYELARHIEIPGYK